VSRRELARALGVVAVLALLVSGAVATAAYVGRDDDHPEAAAAAPEPLVVRDPGSGATFAVPGDGDWTVQAPAARVYYADEQGRPAAVVRGPAVFRDGYCTRRPEGSNRGFAGFTREDFDTWVDALRTSTDSKGVWTTGVDRESVRLADGSSARLYRSAVFLGGGGPCLADGVEIAMVEAGEVRLVLVRDTDAPGTLEREDADAVLTSLRLR
jgi:hypothetical protein